jgi:hypothetical protein
VFLRSTQGLLAQVKLVEKAYQGQASKPACSLSRCNGTGELWDSDGFVSPCGCEWGQKLSPKVLEAFAQINALRRLECTSTAESAPGNSTELGATTIAAFGYPVFFFYFCSVKRRRIILRPASVCSGGTITPRLGRSG